MPSFIDAPSANFTTPERVLRETHDPRIDLEHLPSENLFNIARNPSAVHRALAARLLVERGSPLACADEVIELAKDAIFANPIALAACHKNMNAATAAKLPGPIELIASGLHQHIALAGRVAEAHHAHARDIADLNENTAAQARTVVDRVAALARDLGEQREELKKVLTTHEEELQAVQARLALLERSPWAKLKKLVDH
jgi:hypothetical protein